MSSTTAGRTPHRKNQADFTPDLRKLWKRVSKFNKRTPYPEEVNQMFRGILDYAIDSVCERITMLSNNRKTITPEMAMDALSLFFKSNKLLSAAIEISDRGLKFYKVLGRTGGKMRVHKGDRLASVFTWQETIAETGLAERGGPMIPVGKMTRALIVRLPQKRNISESAPLYVAVACTLFMANIMHLVPKGTRLDRNSVLASIIANSSSFTTIIPQAKIISFGAVNNSRTAGRKISKRYVMAKSTMFPKRKKRGRVEHHSRYEDEDDDEPPTPSF